MGCATGAYQVARAFILDREQLGKPIAAFHLVQGQLARMPTNITARGHEGASGTAPGRGRLTE
ncbi:acyl-CoA dehydrogenase family protein [Streptomyces sp. NPDC090023]|uniref:acyl-CoA dehydrogenase family protein n=1 Tax=unclassified Streptomyces TaxID=2593676 RepID=UPI003823AC33